MCSSAPSLYFVSLFLFLLLLFLLVKLPEEVAIAQGLLFSPPLPSLPLSLPYYVLPAVSEEGHVVNFTTKS